MPDLAPDELRSQLAEQRRKVDFDTYDLTVDELLRRVGAKRIDIAPVYQRQFRWDDRRQSRFVESVLLGIPVPPLFMATTLGGDGKQKWEVVDGLQRLLTLTRFAGSQDTRDAAELQVEPLQLSELDKLQAFSDYRFSELPEDIRNALEDRPLKVIVLNDKSDLRVRYDLFERLNTGGISLTAHEIRECVFRGDFMDLIGSLAASPHFKSVIVLPPSRWKDGTPEDYVLRFFAFHDRYTTFEHSVEGFLTDYVKDAHVDPRLVERTALFESTFRFLSLAFPNGLTTRRGQTPVNLFEGVAVGASLAIEENHNIVPPTDMSWSQSPILKSLVTGATNSRLRVRGRIEYCRDKFLGRR